MEEKNEILAVMKEGFERIDQRLGRIEGDVSILKTDVSGLKTDVSGLKTDVSGLKDDSRKAHVQLEFIIDKAELIKENVVDIRSHMSRYSTEVEHPLEQRVTKLEGRVWLLEENK